MRLDVPVGVDITGSVLLDTGGFNLLEAPLWKVDGTGAEIAANIGVLESERSGQGAELGVIP